MANIHVASVHEGNHLWLQLFSKYSHENTYCISSWRKETIQMWHLWLQLKIGDTQFLKKKIYFFYVGTKGRYWTQLRPRKFKIFIWHSVVIRFLAPGWPVKVIRKLIQKRKYFHVWIEAKYFITSTFVDLSELVKRHRPGGTVLKTI